MALKFSIMQIVSARDLLIDRSQRVVNEVIGPATEQRILRALKVTESAVILHRSFIYLHSHDFL